jgi:CelD/BcsL family acetyltransferase involved in cellulose biosynthesis
MKIIEIHNYRDFLALKDVWNDVLQKCDHSVFSTWDWLSIWWKHFGNDKRLMILLAEEGNKLFGIAPLMYSVHSMFGLRRGKIEFIGTPSSDYNDFIITEKKEECLRLFINHINNWPEKWDCIDLKEIPENAEYMPLLAKFSQKLTIIHKCPYIPLPKSYDLFLKSLSHKLRKNLRVSLRKLEKDDPKVNFTDYSDVQSSNKGMQIFFDLHQKRWISKGCSGVYAEEKARNFHLDIAKSFSQKGWLGLYSLELSGRPVSAHYGFKYDQKFYSYLSGFDPAFYRYGIGKLLIAHVISQCIHQGLTEFDFLRGAEDYKNRWNTKERFNRQAILIRNGFLAKSENWLYNEYWHQGNRLKYFLKIQQ